MNDLEVGSVRPCLLELPSLAMNFSPSVSCYQEKEDKDMSSVWHFWKGLILQINQSTSIGWNWLIGRDQSEGEIWNVLLSSGSLPTPAPRFQLCVANLGPNWNPLNYCAVPRLRFFFIYNFCDLLVIVNWPFPKSH